MFACVCSRAIIKFSYMFCVFVIILWTNCLLFPPTVQQFLQWYEHHSGACSYSGPCACSSSSWLLSPLRCITIVLCLFTRHNAGTRSGSQLANGGKCGSPFYWGQMMHWTRKNIERCEVTFLKSYSW